MANMKCALPAPLVGSILSFTVHGHDESELNRMRSISPTLQKAIDCNPTLFNREEPLLEVRDHKDDSINGVWYLKAIKTGAIGGPIPGTDQVFYPPNEIRNIQCCVVQSKSYTFTRELNGEQRDLVVISRRIVPKHFHGAPPAQDHPMWKAYRMDHAKDPNYDLRLTFPLGNIPLTGGDFVTSKKTIGQDLWSEKTERLCRFTTEQRSMRDQDRSGSKNPATYIPFEPATWIKLVTTLKPVFSDPKSEQERKQRIADQQARMEEHGKVLEDMMKGKTQEEKLEISQSEEFQNEIMQMTQFMQQAMQQVPEPAPEDAWELGEHAMEYFRIRLFDNSGSLAP